MKRIFALSAVILALLIAMVSVTVLAEEETYAVTLQNGTNGALQEALYYYLPYDVADDSEPVDPEAVEAGRQVIVRAMSADGESIAKACTVKDENGFKVTCAEAGWTPYNGNYSAKYYKFTMPQGNVSVELTSKEADTLQVRVSPADAHAEVTACNSKQNTYSGIGAPVSVTEDGLYTWKYDKAKAISQYGNEFRLQCSKEGYFDYCEYLSYPEQDPVVVELDPIVPITEIDSVDDLVAFGEQMNRGYDFEGQTVKLNADLDLSGVKWVPLGMKYRYGVNGNIVFFREKGFCGTFDGQNHTISNLDCSFQSGAPTLLEGGLFWTLTQATVKDLTLDRPVFDAGSASSAGSAYAAGSCGALACYASGSTIRTVTVTEPSFDLVNMQMGSGGLLGCCYDGSVEDCAVLGGTLRNIGGKTGGLIGYATCPTVTRCKTDIDLLIDHASGNQSSTRENFGGLIGQLIGGEISENFSLGDVTVLSEGNHKAYGVGGLIGLLMDSNYREDSDTTVQISDCYASGNVSGQWRCGGLIGSVVHMNMNASAASGIQNCYASGDVAGETAVGGLIGYTLTREHKDVQSTFDIQDVFAIDPNVTATEESAAVGELVGDPSSETITFHGSVLTPEQGSTWSMFADAGWSSDIWTIEEPGTYPVLMAFVEPQEPTFSLTSSEGADLQTKKHTTLTVDVENGNVEDYTYKFIVFNSTTKQWYRLRDFDADNTFDWYTGPAGEKSLYVDVKDSAGNVTRIGLDVSVKEAELPVLSSSKGTQLQPKSRTKLSVSETGTDGNTYKFIVYNRTSKQWYKLRDFAPENTFDWYTGPVGEKTLYADIKDAAGTVQRIALDVTVA